MAAPEMDLSVIIVNYNVRYFLEQCLISVFQAAEGLEVEVIVVDNHSQDDSLEMLAREFGEKVTVIANADNPGFSAANNQGIAIARGRHVLLLNPDTLLAADAFRKCLDFMHQHPDAGALGVYMIDGTGRYLPESKRALPTPWVSFYKIFGLASLFPRHRKFGRYHLGFLDKDQTHPVDVLSGAFMWFRKETLDHIGGLDEAFFMYGEDIDISWRVIQAGWKNYYFPEVKILHYKGESTQKGSLNYVRVFYQAMIIFARKHFGGMYQRLFIAAIRLAVYSRAAVAAFERLIWRAGFPVLEGALIYGAMYGIKSYWEYYIKFIEGGAYPPEFAQVYLPVYAVVFVGLLWAFGAYRRPFRLRPLILAPLAGFVVIATVTYMFEQVLNFSRAIVGLSAIFTGMIAFAGRALLHWRERGSFFFTDEPDRRAVALGTQASGDRIAAILRGQSLTDMRLIGLAGDAEAGSWPVLGPAEVLPEMLETYDADEVCADLNVVPVAEVLAQLERLYPLRTGLKTLPAGRDFLVGPHQVLRAGQGQGGFRLAEARSRRVKRLFDVMAAAGLLVSWPVLAPFLKAPLGAPGRLVQVLGGKRHLVAYVPGAAEGLPPLRPGLLDPGRRAGGAHDQLHAAALNADYARRYHWELDLASLMKGWRWI